MHTNYLNPSELLDARLAAMRETSVAVLTPADIPGRMTTPHLDVFHSITCHRYRSPTCAGRWLRPFPARWAGRDLMAAGVAGWDAAYDEAKERADRRSWANRVTATAKVMLKAEIVEFITSPRKPPGAMIEVKQLSRPQTERSKRFAEICSSQNAQVRGRMMNNYIWNGGHIAGRLYGYFRENLGPGKLRSHLHPHLKRSVQLLPRSERAQTGMNKAAVTNHTKYEAAVLVRDAPYVHGDPRRLGFLVVDLDFRFISADQLYRKLLKHLPRKLMPPLVVSRKSWCGAFAIENPHLVWPMPAGSEVGVTGKSRMLPQRFFKRVQRALVSALIDIGADPNHHNFSKFKSPLAPVWDVCVMNPDLPSLEDFRAKGGIDLHYNEDEMKERALKFRATGPGEDISLSNAVWISCKEKIQRAMLLAAMFQDKEYRQSKHDRARRRQWLIAKVMGPMLEEFPGDDEQVRRVVEAHCDWWSSHRGNQAKKPVARGRDTGAIYKAGMDAKEELNTKERRQTSAQQTNQARTNNTVFAIAGVIAAFARSGMYTTRYAIGQRCEALGIASKSSVYKHYDAAVLLSADLSRDGARYIASPKPALTNHPSNPSGHPVDGFPASNQPPGLPDSGNIERSPPSFWSLPTPCGPPISTEHIDFGFDDAPAIPATSEACSRPRDTLH